MSLRTVCVTATRGKKDAGERKREIRTADVEYIGSV